MELKAAFGQALRQIRRAQGTTQEDFSTVSSRTYISSIERGIKSPTLEKIDSIAEALEVHPLTIMARAYMLRDGISRRLLLERLNSELLDQPQSAERVDGQTIGD